MADLEDPPDALIALGELDIVERKLTRYEKIENLVSVAAGVGLALPYFLWWWAHGWIRTYSCLIPFLIGAAISKFVFSYVETKLERRRKELSEPRPVPLPEARLIERRSEPSIEPPELAPTPTSAPEPAPPPPAAGEEPRLLK